MGTAPFELGKLAKARVTIAAPGCRAQLASLGVFTSDWALVLYDFPNESYHK